MSAKIESYKDLLDWQQAMDLAVATYLTKGWPKEEIYGLTSQASRAASSVPASIAEGYGRENSGSYQQFWRTAQESLKELETHSLPAERIGFATRGAIAPLMTCSESVGKLLRLLIRKLSTC
ncbi:four helix bundle protein [Chelativorans sp. J32]|uniref:four helix bundle protein n=1 Tax=Chelativorans sp. J32 TaxID=935840 RepID=UPI0004865213|nr:four helix bundle protein [Chelativorans sp. J32]